MKIFKRLDTKGFSHEVILVLVVVMVAIGGTYYLVASHADSCSGMSDPVSGVTSSPSSSPTSSPNCTPTSSPTSSPASSPLTYLGKCSISGIANVVKSGTAITPKVLVTNIGTGSIGPKLNAFYHFPGGNSAHQYVTIAYGLAPGASKTVTLAKYVPKTSATASYRYTITGTDSNSTFTCSKVFKVTAPVSNI